MKDSEIIALFYARDERALEQAQRQYGGYCRVIAQRILHCDEDVEECLNDTWLQAWKAIPPHHPKHLSTFLGKITRRLSLNRVKEKGRDKRGGGELPIALDELAECLPDMNGGDTADDIVLRDALNTFIKDLAPAPQRVFVQRYWHLYPIADIAKYNRMSESAVKMLLLRARQKLKQYLEKEGIGL